MLQNLFNYWYDLEFFSPCWPVDPSRDIDLAGHPRPGRARPTWQYGTVTTSISARPRPAAW